MDLATHYKTLGLRQGAPLDEVKVAYRQLVRRYHPDVNPGEQAVEQFIQISDAYTALSEAIKPIAPKKTASRQDWQSEAVGQAQPGPLNLDCLDIDSLKLQLENLGIGSFTPEPAENLNSRTKTTESVEAETIPSSGRTSESSPVPSRPQNAPLSPEERLKQDAYHQLRELLKQHRFPRAIALVEGLAHRMPADSEIIQWQAIVYQRWGRQLIGQGQSHKARIYLTKALRTDPNNHSLWSEVNRDFWQLDNIGEQSSPAV
ncbi:MAG: DnaJ domain-containing protein [Phormidesmis sp.]